MADYLESLRDALVDVINETWPDLTGISHTQELARIPWERSSFPLCVLDLDAQPSAEWGLTNRVDVVTVTISRAVRDSENRAELMENLEALRTALWPDDGSESLEVGQVLEYPAVSDSAGLPVNQYFLASGRPYYCGAVVVRVCVGVSG